MRSSSEIYSPGNYSAGGCSNFSQKRLRKTTSLGLVLLLIAVLVWAFAPLTSDANYKVVSAASTNLNPVGQGSPVASAKALPIDALQDNGSDSAHPSTVAKLTPQLYLDKTKYSGSSVHPAVMPLQPGVVKSFIIESGDTLSKLFQDAGIPLVQAIKLDRTAEAASIKSLKPGREMRFLFTPDGQWEALEYTLSKLKTLIVKPGAEGFAVHQHEKEVTYETVSASDTISSSLGAAGQEAGLSLNMISKLVDVFKWEIDFARDVQPGDRFHMVYQKAFVGNDFIDDGEILAAQFWNNGEAIKAIRYETADGKIAYYKPNGESLKRGFLRTPVKLGRITSGFTKRRLHPIKKTWRAHKGVDYGAKSGTPILATGDGVVQYAGRKGGYGNTVVLRHGGEYTTLYAHMRKFAKGIRNGKRVTQGQVIGYVGSTGWATGPHLHYEFRINSKHKNPLKVDFPRTDPIAKSEMAEFKVFSKKRLAQLDQSIQIETAQR